MTDGVDLTLIEKARRAATAAGFPHSCSLGTAGLLIELARSLPDRARVGESGTGFGVGSAALASGMPATATLVTVEVDADRAAAARDLLAGDQRITVVTESRDVLSAYGPFDLLFLDGGPKPVPDEVLALLAPGGVAVVDDFTPSVDPANPMFEGGPDDVRLAYIHHPHLAYQETRVGDVEAVVILRRAQG